jgi:hypothetical protein
MRTALILTLFVAACAADQTIERDDIQYSTNPSTGMCVVNPATAMSAGWTNCDPDCSTTNSCAPTCMDPACPMPSTNTMTVACPGGYAVDASGCPTCECAPECDPTTMTGTGMCPPPTCDPMTDPNCSSGGGGGTMCNPMTDPNCSTTGGGGSGSGGTMCDPMTDTSCP